MRLFGTISATFALLLMGAPAAIAAVPLEHLAIIQNEKDAIVVARALLSARDHAFPSANVKLVIYWGNRDDEFWQRHCTATLNDGVWEVKSKPEYIKDYGHLKVLIGEQDGRFLGSEKDVPLR
jgi:hypothetical protein